MSNWGYGILEDDLSLDIYGDFIERYNDGLDLDAIRAAVIKRYWEYFFIPEDNSKVWLGLAQAEWECGRLSPETRQAVEIIVENGLDLTLWSDKDSRHKRHAVLLGFLEKLKTETPCPRKRVKHKVPAAIFSPGTCLTISLWKGGWGAAIVLDVVSNKYDTMHLVGGLRGIYDAHPAMDIYEKRNWLVLTHHNFKDKGEFHLTWCGTGSYKNDIKTCNIIEVGRTVIRPDDPTLPVNSRSGSWGWIENQIWLQHQWEGTKQ